MGPKKILIVEDNDGDVFLMQEALENAGLPVKITVVNDGSYALEVLEASISDNELIPFDLIFLDINIPKKSGLEVLTYIKEHPLLRIIPTVMFTSSANFRDISACLGNHANAYLIKPIALDVFMISLQQTLTFFCETHFGIQKTI